MAINENFLSVCYDEAVKWHNFLADVSFERRRGCSLYAPADITSGVNQISYFSMALITASPRYLRRKLSKKI